MAPSKSRKIPSSASGKEGMAFTWDEVAKHNSADSCWVIIRGEVFDITDWLDRHPGGREMLLLAAGRECTNLFDSYHPFSTSQEKYLKTMKIGKLAGQTEFPEYKTDSGFYKELRQEVKQYFDENRIDSKDPVPGLWRMTLVFGVALLSWLAMNAVWVAEPDQWALRLLASFVFGICQALPLLHVMHDASHTAIGHSETWWKAIGRFCMEWYAGASMMSWHHQHVVGHHIYTNVMGVDPDLPQSEQGDPRRIVKRQRWAWMYRFQHIYLPILYGLLGLKFRLQDITDTYVSRSNGSVRVNYYDNVWLRLVAVKFFWVFWRVFVPLYVLRVPGGEFWTMFVIAELMTGYWLAFNFQVSHVSVVADFPQGEQAKESTDDEWAISQVKSSVDYAHGNSICTFLCGALNYQIVHHLFPSVSQYQYPAIAPIVKRVCARHGIRYNMIPTFGEAFRLHLKHLYEMGQRGEAAHID